MGSKPAFIGLLLIGMIEGFSDWAAPGDSSELITPETISVKNVDGVSIEC